MVAGDFETESFAAAYERGRFFDPNNPIPDAAVFPIAEHPTFQLREGLYTFTKHGVV